MLFCRLACLSAYFALATSASPSTFNCQSISYSSSLTKFSFQSSNTLIQNIDYFLLPNTNVGIIEGQVQVLKWTISLITSAVCWRSLLLMHWGLIRWRNTAVFGGTFSHYELRDFAYQKWQNLDLLAIFHFA